MTNGVPKRGTDVAAQRSSRGRFMTTSHYQIRGLGAVCILFAGLFASAGIDAATAAINRVTVGQFVAEPATLQALGFEWYVQGDDNRNAVVAVSYRKHGESAWKEAQPLIRLHNERNKGPGEFVAPNVFVGSIFDLEPGAEYDCRFVLSDPDGVSGTAQKIVTAHTRPEPMPAAGGHVYHVYPYENRGPYEQPAFYGLYAAWYDGIAAADHYNVSPARVQPGDTILVHAGVYRENRTYYGSSSRKITGRGGPGECCGTTGDGTYYLTFSGTADKPIVIKAAGDGEAIFDGAGNHTLFNVMGGNHIYFEGITFRDTDVAIEAGIKGITGSRGLTVKHSKFDHVGVGVHTDWSGSGDFYIADNEFIGKVDPKTLVGFSIRAAVRQGAGDAQGAHAAVVTVCGQALWLGSRGSLQPRALLSRRYRFRDVRAARWLPEHDSRAHAGFERLLQQRHLARARRLRRDRRCPLQHPCLSQLVRQRSR
ncbi:MAG: hypothetical protein WDO68_22755 [Gammaproteobacteria bacterium]